MNSVIKLCALLIGFTVNVGTLPCTPISETEVAEELYITAAGVAYTLEEYVTGIVMAEVPYTFETDALMAQAVAARTYCVYSLARGSDSREKISCAFETKEGIAARFGADYAEKAYKIAFEAAKTTAGQILASDGEPILAVWHASSYRSTEASVNVWGGERSYLRGSSSPESVATIMTEAEFELSEVKKLLAEEGYPSTDGYNYNMKDSLSMTQNSAGRCETLTIGNVTLAGTKVRTLFGLRSTDFTVKISDGKLRFKVYGYGHGVGMSQLGSNILAKSGSSYDEILAHYYPGSSLLTLRKKHGIIFPNL